MKTLLSPSILLATGVAIAATGMFCGIATADTVSVGRCAAQMDQQNTFPCEIEDGTMMKAEENLLEYLLAKGATETGEAMPDVTIKPGVQKEAMEPVPPEAEYRSTAEVKAAIEAVEQTKKADSAFTSVEAK